MIIFIYLLFLGTDDITPQAVLRGHERGIDTVAVSPNSNRIATGSWDSNLKIWTTSLENESFEPINKRSKGPNALMTKVPTNTLKGHKEAISSVQWINNSELSTASMDHTIKFWDVEVKIVYTKAHSVFRNRPGQKLVLPNIHQSDIFDEKILHQHNEFLAVSVM